MDTPLRLVRRLRKDARRRDVVDAAVVLLFGILLGALGMVDTNGDGWGPGGALESPQWHLAPLVLGCAVLLAKRRRPVATVLLLLPLVLADLSIGGSLGMYVVMLDALFCLMLFVRQEWVRPAVVAIAVPVVAAPTVTYVASGDVRLAALMLLQFLALLGTPVWWGLSVRQQAQIAELASARADDLQRLSALRRDQAVADERSRMAQDLHDALSSNLSTIAIHSEAALSGAAGAPDAATGRALTEIRASSVRALEDMRQMILLLQTEQDHVTPAARLTDIGPLVDAARTMGLRVVVGGDPRELPSLPSAVDHAGYRIVQESLANAVKHAPGADVTVSLAAGDGVLRVQVASGAGESTALPPLGSGLGLRTMEDRARTLGGTFAAGWEDDVRDRTDRTWVVTVELPLEEVGAR